MSSVSNFQLFQMIWHQKSHPKEENDDIIVFFEHHMGNLRISNPGSLPREIREFANDKVKRHVIFKQGGDVVARDRGSNTQTYAYMYENRKVVLVIPV